VLLLRVVLLGLLHAHVLLLMHGLGHSGDLRPRSSTPVSIHTHTPAVVAGRGLAVGHGLALEQGLGLGLWGRMAPCTSVCVCVLCVCVCVCVKQWDAVSALQ
jgi:hypothetical protein